jgi:bifunctional non-homologous end joining protein LigD
MQLAACSPAPALEALELMEPSLGCAPFSSAEWTFALTTPGYRMLAEFGAGIGARLRSRRGVDAKRWFPEVAWALAALPTARTVVDGGICALDAAGRSDLQRLHARALRPGHPPGTSPVVMCLRDVLVWRGEDVRALPWRERRRRLEGLSLQGQATLRLEHTMPAQGAWLCRQARALGREAIHAHHAAAPYVAGPSIAWLRIPVEPTAQDLAA